jgi:hypothetical protein
MRVVLLAIAGALALGAVGLAQDVDLAGVFQDAGLGYEIRFPADWIYDLSSPSTVVFSGDFWTDAYYSTVTLRKIPSAEAGGAFSDASEVVKDLKCQLVSESPDVRVRDGEPWTWDLTGGPKLVGPEFTAEFERDGESFQAWYVIFPHPDGKAFASFTYTSPADTYDTYLEIAEAMFDAWKFLTEPTPGGAAPTSPSGTSGGN